MALYFSLINHRSVPLMVQAFDPRDVHNIHLFLLGQSCRAAPIAVSDHNSKSLRCANRVYRRSRWNVRPRASTVIKPHAPHRFATFHPRVAIEISRGREISHSRHLPRQRLTRRCSSRFHEKNRYIYDNRGKM